MTVTQASDMPRWRVYLVVGRVSNLPTVWTNCLAGATLALSAPPPTSLAWVALAISCFYTAGMYLNDAFDAGHDRVHRPERPIPRGLVSEARVYAIGVALLVAGELLLLAPAPGGRPTAALALGGVLAALIVYYSWRHKRDPLSAVVVALCRGCVYLIAGAWATGGVSALVASSAVVMTIYVIALSQLSKRNLMPGRVVARLIAGISLVDAAFILWVSGRVELALLAACGFPLTLAGQRFAPGT